MNPIPQMDCCTMLGVDPKTLRNWLRQASISFVAHPTDARLKCLTRQHVEQLATLHARPLQAVPPAWQVLRQEATALDMPKDYPPLKQEREAPRLATPASLSEEAQLRKRVCDLETKVMIMQENMTQLTFDLLRERSERYEQRLSGLEALLSQEVGRLPSGHEAMSVADRRSERFPEHEHSPHPLEQPIHSQGLPARVEYRANGTYAVISAEYGDLPLVVDSPEWFDWLATLSSFRFVGRQGRFGAGRRYDRDHNPTRSWSAHRSIHQRNYNRHLGLTEHLTVAHLELMAAKFQSYLDML